MSSQKIYDHVLVSLSTLGNNAAIGTVSKIDGARQQGCRIRKLMLAVSAEGRTATEGPLMYGICNLELTAAEIAEAIVADPQGPEDTPASEQVNREIMVLGLLKPNVLLDSGLTLHTEIKYPWKTIPEEQGIQYWVMNRSGGTLTAGSLIKFNAFIYGDWLED